METVQKPSGFDKLWISF